MFTCGVRGFLPYTLGTYLPSRRGTSVGDGWTGGKRCASLSQKDGLAARRSQASGWDTHPKTAASVKGVAGHGAQASFGQVKVIGLMEDGVEGHFRQKD